MASGFSTGGAIAIMARAVDPRISKLCLLYPVLSFQYNFIAAAYSDKELILPLKDWDKSTPWRKIEFTKEKLQASIEENKPFSLTAHTYGAGFIKGCKELVDDRQDIQNFLLQRDNLKPVTIVQGTNDFFVPHTYASAMQRIAQNQQLPLRLVTMEGMNHWVPPQWKKSVLYQFEKAATQTPQEFKFGHTTVTLRPAKKGFASLNALFQ